jgi:hypothetical protein
MNVYHWILIVAVILMIQGLVIELSGRNFMRAAIYFKVIPIFSGLFLLLYAIKMLHWI